jgi:hypothetical protein
MSLEKTSLDSNLVTLYDGALFHLPFLQNYQAPEL